MAKTEGRLPDGSEQADEGAGSVTAVGPAGALPARLISVALILITLVGILLLFKY